LSLRAVSPRQAVANRRVSAQSYRRRLSCRGFSFQCGRARCTVETAPV